MKHSKLSSLFLLLAIIISACTATESGSQGLSSSSSNNTEITLSQDDVLTTATTDIDVQARSATAGAIARQIAPLVEAVVDVEVGEATEAIPEIQESGSNITQDEAANAAVLVDEASNEAAPEAVADLPAEEPVADEPTATAPSSEPNLVSPPSGETEEGEFPFLAEDEISDDGWFGVLGQPLGNDTVSVLPDPVNVQAVPTTYVVTSSANPGDGVCNADCTLYEAVVASNASVGVADTIEFNIAGAGVHSIDFASAELPSISDPVVIDATTQPGYAGMPLIHLMMSVVPNNFLGFHIAADDTTVKGFSITNFYMGIYVTGETGSVIQSNFIGMLPDGLTPEGNEVFGIYIYNLAGYTSGGHQIGGTAGQGNLISGNGETGIAIFDEDNAGGVPTTIQSNYIGTDVTGTITDPDGIADSGDELGNLGHGIDLYGFTNQVTVGGIGLGNLISGNFGSGIRFDKINFFYGNYIGTDVTGTVGLGNHQTGILEIDSTENIRREGWGDIGGNNPGEGNLISDNGYSGIYVRINYSSMEIKKNYIGVDSTGLQPLGNGYNGIAAIGSGFTIGLNVVSANGADGLMLQSGDGNIYSNIIGAAGDGNHSDPAFGNAYHGIRIIGSRNQIRLGNLIVNNGGHGVSLELASNGGIPANNEISENSIFNNAGLGIDVWYPGVSPNDYLDKDYKQNYPVIFSATSDGVDSDFEIGIHSSKGSGNRIDLYLNDACDPSGYGEGQTYITSVEVVTDGINDPNPGYGFGTFTLNEPLPIGSYITATAVNSLTSFSNPYDTSEFSPCEQIIPSPPDTPTLISPDGATLTTLPLVLSWNETFVTDFYEVRIYRVSDDVDILVKNFNFADVCSAGTCTAEVPYYFFNDDYAWQVRGHNITGISAYSTPMLFTVNVDRPDVLQNPVSISDLSALGLGGGAPYQIEVTVTGKEKDCGGRMEIEQSQLGMDITLSIFRKMNANKVCNGSLKDYSETIMLTGTFAAGAYTITVNGETINLNLP